MITVAIIEFGMGNIDSIARAVELCDANPLITSKFEQIKGADQIILPGVGSFFDGMSHMKERGLIPILNEVVIQDKKPTLGICLGMQLFADKGYEGGETEGLGWIEGEVRRLTPTKLQEKIPHIGWNEVYFQRESPLWEGIPIGKNFYFAHSYHFVGSCEEHILAKTSYCGEFVSAVSKENIFGVQFHPEKSQRVGIQLIRNFISLSQNKSYDQNKNYSNTTL